MIAAVAIFVDKSYLFTLQSGDIAYFSETILKDVNNHIHSICPVLVYATRGKHILMEVYYSLVMLKSDDAERSYRHSMCFQCSQKMTLAWWQGTKNSQLKHKTD